MIKPGTLCIIVFTAPWWRCALGHIVTVVGTTMLGSSVFYKFVPPAFNGYDHCDLAGPQCLKPLDDPDVYDEQPRDEELVA